MISPTLTLDLRQELQQVEPVFKYEYRWNRMGRKGTTCRVLSRGKMNSCLVEFADGHKAITSRNALSKKRRAA
jgi:hypothetical protein